MQGFSLKLYVVGVVLFFNIFFVAQGAEVPIAKSHSIRQHNKLTCIVFWCFNQLKSFLGRCFIRSNVLSFQFFIGPFDKKDELPYVMVGSGQDPVATGSRQKVPKRLMSLFPSPNKQILYHQWLLKQVFNSFPQDPNRTIVQCWMALENGTSFCSAQENFVQRLLNNSIYWHNKEKKWDLPADIQLTHDGKYYVGWRGSQITIYNAQTKDIVATLPHKRKFTLLQNRNLLLVGDSDGDRNLYLYDIENNAKHILREESINDRGFVRVYTDISRDENYIAVTDQTSLWLWNIEDLNKISCYRRDYPAAYSVVLSADNTLLAVVCLHALDHNLTTTQLWKIEDGKLKSEKPIAECDSDAHPDTVRFVGNELLVLSRDCLNNCFNYVVLNITSSSDGNVNMTELDLPVTTGFSSYSRPQVSDHIAICDTINHSTPGSTVTIVTSSGKIIYQEPEKSMTKNMVLSNDEKHLIVMPWGMTNPERTSQIWHLCHISKDIPLITKCTIARNDGNKIAFNQQSSLIVKNEDYASCIFDLHGNVVKAFLCPEKTWETRDKYEPYFHPNGRAVIIKDKLYTLHSKNTPEHCNNLVKNMTVPLYGALRMICSETESLRSDLACKDYAPKEDI